MTFAIWMKLLFSVAVISWAVGMMVDGAKVRVWQMAFAVSIASIVTIVLSAIWLL